MKKINAIVFSVCITLVLFSAPAFSGNPGSCSSPQEETLFYQRKFAQAMALAQMHLDQLPSSPSTPQEIELSICLRTRVAYLLGRTEQPQKAIAALEPLATEAAQKLGENHPQAITTGMDLAMTYGIAGNYGLELKTLQNLQTRIPAQSNTRQRKQLLEEIANSYTEIGNNEDALALNKQILTIVQDPHGLRYSKADIADAKYRVGEVLVRLNRHPEAKPYIEDAIALSTADSGATSPSTLDYSIALTEIYRRDGQIAEAIALDRKIVETAESTLGVDDAITRKAKGSLSVHLYRAGNNNREAAKIAQEQIVKLQKKWGIGHPETLFAISNYANMMWGMSDYEEAQTAYELAINSITRLRAKLQFDDNLALAWQNQWYPRDIGGYIYILLRDEKYIEALTVAETFKTNLLADRLSFDSAEHGMSDEQIKSFRKLRRKISDLDQTVLIKKTLGQQTSLEENSRSELVQQLENLVQSNAVTTAATVPMVTPPDWYKLMQAKESKSLRVSYIFNYPSLHALVDDGTGLKNFSLGNSAQVKRLIETYRLAVRNSVINPKLSKMELADMAALKKNLSDVLVAPFAEQLKGKSRVLISTDQTLAYVPFDALELGGARLGDQAEVVVLPSFSLYDRLFTRKIDYAISSRDNFIGFGGAEYQRIKQISPGIYVQNEKLVLTPMDTSIIAQKARKDPAKFRQIYVGYALGFHNLPASLDEVKTIAQGFKDQTSLVETGQSASEANLYQLDNEGTLAKYRYVHFSTHGYLNDDEPGLSSIVLSQVNRQPGTDGFITVPEVSSLNLKSDLVVVSACDSGIGKTASGEGILGMSYALFQAGTVGSIVTLWPIPDKQSSQLMIHLYEELRSGLSPAKALAVTKRWGLQNDIGTNVVDAFVYFGI